MTIQANRSIRIKLHFRVIVCRGEPQCPPNSRVHATLVVPIIDTNETVDAANASSRGTVEIGGCDLDPIHECCRWWARQVNRSRDHMLIGGKGGHVSALRKPRQKNILPKWSSARKIVPPVCTVLVIPMGIEILQHHRDPLRDGVCGVIEIVGLARS